MTALAPPGLPAPSFPEVTRNQTAAESLTLPYEMIAIRVDSEHGTTPIASNRVPARQLMHELLNALSPADMKQLLRAFIETRVFESASNAWTADELTSTFGCGPQWAGMKSEDLPSGYLAIPRHSDKVDEGTSDEVPFEYLAFKEIGQWLNASDEEVAKAVDIGGTTVYSWKRDGHQPRRRTARRLYEYHAALSSLNRQLGPEQFRAWLELGDPSPRTMMLRGDLEATNEQIDDVLFRTVDSGIDLAWSPEPEHSGEDLGAESTLDPPRPSERKVRSFKI